MAKDEEKALWLFDLAHENLKDDAIVKGFLRHYALNDKTIFDVKQDLHFRTSYGDRYLESAESSLKRAMENFVCGKD